jgi:hypothetical protein
VHASWRAYALATLATFCLALLVTRRLPSRHWSVHHAFPGHGRNPRFSGAAARSAFFLLASGCLLGLSVLSNATFVLIALAGLLCFFPWSRLAIVRDHFMSACSSMWIGIAASIVIGWDASDVMFFPVAAWLFWMCAFIALVSRAGYARRAGNASGPMVPQPGQGPASN